MVGSAQYRDDEIGWILAAVVARKKQDFIRRHFENRFGRPLNHNQIRYIKNKYGKDPRFNSPLVNIRPCTDGSSASDTPDSNDLDEIVPIPTIPLPEAFALTLPSRPQSSQNDGQTKRKRALDDDSLASSTKRQVGLRPKEAQPAPDPETPCESTLLSSVPRWNPIWPQLTHSMYGISQQLMQDKSGLSWASYRDGPWTFDERSNLMNPSSHIASAALQGVASSPMGLNSGLVQTSSSGVREAPLGTHANLAQVSQLSSSYAAATPFSPSMSPIVPASHASPLMDTSVMAPLNHCPPTTPSMSYRRTVDNLHLASGVTIDCRASDHEWNHQSTPSGLYRSSQNQGGSMAWATPMAPYSDMRGCSFEQAIFPAYQPVVGHRGFPEVSSNYILSPGATACSPPPPLRFNQPLPGNVNARAHLGSSFHNAPSGDNFATVSPLSDSIMNTNSFGWLHEGHPTVEADLQKPRGSRASLANPGQGLSQIEKAIFETVGQELHQEIPMQGSQWTSMDYNPMPILSNIGATESSPSLATAAQTAPSEQVMNDNFIDPSLLEAFDLNGDFGMTFADTVSHT